MSGAETSSERESCIEKKINKPQNDEKKKKLNEEDLKKLTCSELNDNKGYYEYVKSLEEEEEMLLKSNGKLLTLKNEYNPLEKININSNDILPNDKKFKIIKDSRKSIKDLKKNVSFQNVISGLEEEKDIPNLKQYINDFKDHLIFSKIIPKLNECIEEIENSPVELPNSDEMFKDIILLLISIKGLECNTGEPKIKDLGAKITSLEKSLKVEDHMEKGNNETFKEIVKDLPKDLKTFSLPKEIIPGLNRCIVEIESSPVELPMSYEIFKDTIRILMDIKKLNDAEPKSEESKLKVIEDLKGNLEIKNIIKSLKTIVDKLKNKKPDIIDVSTTTKDISKQIKKSILSKYLKDTSEQIILKLKDIKEPEISSKNLKAILGSLQKSLDQINKLGTSIGKLNVSIKSANSIEKLKKNKTFKRNIEELGNTELINNEHSIALIKNQLILNNIITELKECKTSEAISEKISPILEAIKLEGVPRKIQIEESKAEVAGYIKSLGMIIGWLETSPIKPKESIEKLQKGVRKLENNETFKEIINQLKDKIDSNKHSDALPQEIITGLENCITNARKKISEEITRINGLVEDNNAESDVRKTCIEELKAEIKKLKESVEVEYNVKSLETIIDWLKTSSIKPTESIKKLQEGVRKLQRNNEPFKDIIKQLKDTKVINNEHSIALIKDRLILNEIIPKLCGCETNKEISDNISSINNLESDIKKTKIKELKENIKSLKKSIKVKVYIKKLETIIGWLEKSSIKPTESIKKLEESVRNIKNNETFVNIINQLNTTTEGILKNLNEEYIKSIKVSDEIRDKLIECIKAIEEKELPMSMWILINDTIRIITHIKGSQEGCTGDWNYQFKQNVNKLERSIELEKKIEDLKTNVKGHKQKLNSLGWVSEPFFGREKSIKVFNKYKEAFFFGKDEGQFLNKNKEGELSGFKPLAAIGIPGAGKTTFIKNMSAEVNEEEFISVVVTYSDQVELSNDKDEHIKQFTTQLLSSNGISKETAQSPPSLEEIIEQLFDLKKCKECKKCKGMIIFVDDLIPHDGQKGNVQSLISELMTIQNNSRKKENPNKPVMFVFTGLDSNYLKAGRPIFCIPLCNLSPENSILAIADEKMKVIRKSKSLWQSFLSCGGNPGLLSLLDTNDSESVFSYKIKESYSRVKLNIINNFLNYENVCRWFTGSVSEDDLKLWKAWKEKGLIQDADGLQYLVPQLLRLWANDDNNDDIDGNNNLIKLLKNHLRDAYEGDVLCVPGQEKNMETVTMNFECIRKILVGNGKEVTVEDFFAGAKFSGMKFEESNDFKNKKLKIIIPGSEKTSLVKFAENLGKSEDVDSSETKVINRLYNKKHGETILQDLKDGYTVASEKQNEKGVERIVPFSCGDKLLVALMQDKFVQKFSAADWLKAKNNILESECVEFLERKKISYFVVFNTTAHELKTEEINRWEGIGYEPIGCVYFTGTELIENTFRFGPLKLNCGKLEETVNGKIKYSSAKTKYPHLHKDYN